MTFQVSLTKHAERLRWRLTETTLKSKGIFLCGWSKKIIDLFYAL